LDFLECHNDLSKQAIIRWHNLESTLGLLNLDNDMWKLGVILLLNTDSSTLIVQGSGHVELLLTRFTTDLNCRLSFEASALHAKIIIFMLLLVNKPRFHLNINKQNYVYT
jgi:hypothetical protein